MFVVGVELLKSVGLKGEIGSQLSFRMIIAFFMAFIITLGCGRRFILKLYEWKVGDRVRVEDCPLLGKLHQNKNNTPTMGGILILFALVIVQLMWMDLTNSFTWLLFFTLVSIGTLGGIDDYLKLRYKNKRGLPPRFKFLWQIATATLVGGYLLITKRETYSGIYLPFVESPLLIGGLIGAFLLLLFFIFVITGSSNAVNLTDGLDGLAAGCLVSATAAFAVIAFIVSNLHLSSYFNLAYIDGSEEIAILLVATVGSLIGFLWYNGYPAQLFMGDTGSLSLGALLGVVSVILQREIWLAIIGAIFVGEALSVILQVGSYKLRNKKRIFLIAPLHHHFEYKGVSETKVVMRFWIAGFLFALIGLITLTLQ